MSAPRNDAEVQKVLTAIRHLIEKGRPPRLAPTATAPDRLVLTPALRVGEAAAPDGTLVLADAQRRDAAPERRIPETVVEPSPASAESPAPSPEARSQPTFGTVAALQLSALEPPSVGLPGPSAPPPLVAAAPNSAESIPETPPVFPQALSAPPVLDEAALRAMVVEIVREELRGELGERLTRNLRKLVRREVMQALTVRDL